MRRPACLVAAIAAAVVLLAPAALAAGNQPPSFTSTPPLTATVGEFYLYDANATDPENDVLTYYLTFKIDDQSLDPQTGALTWKPTKAGPQPVTIYVTDGITSAVAQTFTVEVAPKANSAPDFTSDPPRDALTGRQYTYDANAVDPDGDQVYFGLDSPIPRGMTIDESTGVVSWVPGDEYLNKSAFVHVTAKDIYGHTADQQIYISVKAPPVVRNNPPGINGTPVISVYIGSTYYYKINGTDLDGDPLTYTLVMGPPAMKLNATTGVLNWTPDPLDKGTQPVKVNISDGKDTFTFMFSISVRDPPIPEYYFTDPARPNVFPEVMCFFLPAIVLMVQAAFLLHGARKRLAAAPKRPMPSELRQ